MDINQKILVKKDSLLKIQSKLNEFRVMLSDGDMQLRIVDLLEVLEEELRDEDITLKDIIKEKMDATKISNPELNFKLYMLYRKMSDGKINEEEALKTYQLYIR